MSYNILGITPGHHGSIALVSNGELIFFLEEDRLSKIKYDDIPLKTMYYIFNRYQINELVISGVNIELIPLNIYEYFIRKFSPKTKLTMMHTQHHLTHASCAFYNSGFKTSAVIVIDSAGSTINFDNKIICEENETIFRASYPNKFTPLFKTYFSRSTNRVYHKDFIINDSLNITKAYEVLTQHLGFSSFDAGKTMGLSSFGEPNNLPKFFNKGRGNRDIFCYQPHISGYIDIDSNPELKLENTPEEWHRDSSKVINLEKDMAYNMQQESQELVGDLVEKAIELTGQTNICITGGYGLNCVANYYMLKRFPNINFYHEPLAHDAGTSAGAALYRWYEYSKDTTIRPRKTLYKGPQYTKNHLINSIKKYI